MQGNRQALRNSEVTVRLNLNCWDNVGVTTREEEGKERKVDGGKGVASLIYNVT